MMKAIGNIVFITSAAAVAGFLMAQMLLWFMR